MIYSSGALTIKFILFQVHFRIRPEQRFIGMETTKVLFLGFFANGKFHGINPQMISAIHGRPEIPSTSPSVRPPPSITTRLVRSLSNTSWFKAQLPGLFPPSHKWYNIRGWSQVPVWKILDKNLSLQMWLLCHSNLRNPCPKIRQTRMKFPSCETKTSNTTATRSNLVSLIKTSLIRQEHSKENVQPLLNIFTERQTKAR